MCCILIPVGPNDAEIDRLSDLLDSLFFFESRMSTVLLLDDAQQNRHLAKMFKAPKRVRIKCLRNLRTPHAAYLPKAGGLGSAILQGLGWIARNTHASFVVKLDTDSLIDNHFSKAIQSELYMSSNLGMLGCIGRTCDRTHSLFGYLEDARQKIEALSIPVPDRSTWPDDAERIEVLMPSGRSTITRAQAESILHLRPRLVTALQNGYISGLYCQGGAYVLSARFIELMQTLHLYEDARYWTVLPIGEDLIISLYIYTVGLRLQASVHHTNLFGVQWRGLPFTLEHLEKERYAFLHSVRENSVPEAQVRSLFKAHRNISD